MGYHITQQSELHRQAIAGVLTLSVEARVDAAVIGVFRNVIPNVKNYFQEVMTHFTAGDETDFNFQKASREFKRAEDAVRDLNLVKSGHVLLQTPEGFVSHYVPYLEWLDDQAIKYIHDADAALRKYYTELSMFISNPRERVGLTSTNQQTAAMQKRLDVIREALGSFFDSRTSTAVRPASDLFDRASDIKRALSLAETLNRKRLQINHKDILSLTKQISELLNLLVESSETDKIPEVTSQMADNIARGALVAAHYVEMIGVLRYRIEEALASVCIMADQVVQMGKQE